MNLKELVWDTLDEKMPSIVKLTSVVIEYPNSDETDFSMPKVVVIVLDWSASALITEKMTSHLPPAS